MDFVIYVPLKYSDTCGGIMVLYELARTIDELGYRVGIFNKENASDNPVFNRHVNVEDVNQRTCVIYPEVTRGNPLDAKHVVRWILMDPNRRMKTKEGTKTWKKTDRLMYFSSFNPTVSVSLERTLFVLNINPCFQITNYGERRSNAYCVRKAKKFHKSIPKDHPPDSIQIVGQHHDELIEIFNRCKYFFCYDPYTYIAFVAAMCGCVAIVTPINGVSKAEWIDTLFCKAYFDHSEDAHSRSLYGIAYGNDSQEVARAETTVRDAKMQQIQMQRFGLSTCKAFCNSWISQKHL